MPRIHTHTYNVTKGGHFQRKQRFVVEKDRPSKGGEHGRGSLPSVSVSTPSLRVRTIMGVKIIGTTVMMMKIIDDKQLVEDPCSMKYRY